MYPLSRQILLIILLTPFAIGVQAQTHPEGTTLPEALSTPTLGGLVIEPINASGIAVVQDHQGFMWFAGHDGLVRYDGYSYTPYHHDAQDSTTLSFDRLESLYIDQDGTLWVGTFGGGLNRYDQETDTFTRFMHDPADPTSLSQDTVTVILEDRDGTLWVGTHGGLNRLDRQTGTFTHFRHDPKDATSLSNDQVRALYEDRQGTLWVGTGEPDLSMTPTDVGGLNRLNRQRETFTRYLHDPKDPTSLSHNKIMSLYEDPQGTFWVGTLGDGLHTMDREAGTFTRHRYDPEDPTKLSRPFRDGAPLLSERCQGYLCGGVSFIHQDQQGLLWIGGFNGGVNRYDLETGAMSHHEVATSGLEDDQVWRIAESHDGTIWLGAWSGMHRVTSSVNAFSHYAQDPLDPNSLGGSFVTEMHEDRAGMLWLVAWPNGVDRLDRATGVFTHYRNDPDDPASVASNIYALYEDQMGVLWMGGGDGLSRLDRATGRFTHFRHDPQDPASLSRSDVEIIRGDRPGRLWVGTWGDGLDRFDYVTGTATHHRHDPDDVRSLSNNVVLSLYKDREGTLWIGTQNGLSRFDEEAKAFTNYLSGRVITSMDEDQAGRFWVGTWGDGLHRFDRQTGTSKRYGLKDGLASNKVAGLVENDGALWISTAKGQLLAPVQGQLSRFDPDGETFTNFDKNDGLPEIGFWMECVVKGWDGTLFFGGDRGFMAFNPKAIRGHPPKMTLTSLRVFNDEVVPGLEAPIQQPIHLAEEIRFTHDQNDFTIDYIGLAFLNRGELQYQYMLENHDVGWVRAKAQRSARYSGVAPGTYLFRVRAVDSRGLRSEEDASIRVVILPPWWTTAWFRALMILGVVGLAFSGYRWRVRSFRRQNQQLEAQVRTRTAELEARNEELDAYAYMVAHDLKTPLFTINGFLNFVKKGIATGNTERILEDLERISQATDKMKGIIDALLLLSQARKTEVALDRLDMTIIVSEARHRLASAIREKNATIIGPEHWPAALGYAPWVEEVWTNYLSNAIKYGGAPPRIEIGATPGSDNMVRFWIKDNGKGLTTAQQARLFVPFTRLDGEVATGHGLGLAIVKRIVEGMNGVVEVESEEEQGSVFSFSLPAVEGFARNT